MASHEKISQSTESVEKMVSTIPSLVTVEEVKNAEPFNRVPLTVPEMFAIL